jgi:hypothetical protein
MNININFSVVHLLCLHRQVSGCIKKEKGSLRVNGEDNLFQAINVFLNTPVVVLSGSVAYTLYRAETKEEIQNYDR